MGQLGQRLKLVRTRRGLSLRELGRELREDFTLLSKIEAGTRVPPKTKRTKYARLLGLTETQLNTIIAVERADLIVDEFCPEIQPPVLEQAEIEQAAGE